MAIFGTQIIELPNSSELTGNEVVPLVQNGITSKATISQIAAAAIVTPQFLVLATSPDLVNERVFGISGSGLAATDGGAGNSYLISLAGTVKSLQDNSTTGILVKETTSTVSTRSLVPPSAGITITNADAIAGNPTFALANSLSSLQNLSGVGSVFRVGSDTLTLRELTGTSNQINVTDGNGVAGAPVFSIASDPVLPGTGGVTLPQGTTAQRAGTVGTIRWNTSLGKFEGYDGSNWAPIGSGGGGAVDSVNGQTGTVVLDADDISDSGTTNKFVTAAQIANFHAPATIGTANGLSIAGQAISLAAASSTSTGALTSTDWSTFNSKQNAITTGTTAQYFRGDLSLATFPTNVSAFTNDAGYLTSNQTITLTGDVTGSGTTGITTTIANDAITYAKMQNVTATDRLLGRQSAGAGDVEEITCTAFARSILDDADAAAVRATIGAGTGSVAGTSGQLQFNNAGAFGADSQLDWDNTNKRLSVGTSSKYGAKINVLMGGSTEIGTVWRAPATYTGNYWEIQDNPGNALLYPRQIARVNNVGTAYTSAELFFTQGAGRTLSSIRPHSSGRGLELVGGGAFGEIFSSGQMRSDGGFNCSTGGNDTSLLPGFVGKANTAQGMATPGDGSNGSYLQFYGEAPPSFAKTLMAEFYPGGPNAGIRFYSNSTTVQTVSIRAAASQTADTFQIRDASDNVGFAIEGDSRTIKGYRAKGVNNAATSITIGSSDTGTVIRTTAGTAVSVTLSATAAVDTTVGLIQMGAGQCTFASTGSGTVRNRQSQFKTAGQYANVSLMVVSNVGGSAAEWVLAGDTVA